MRQPREVPSGRGSLPPPGALRARARPAGVAAPEVEGEPSSPAAVDDPDDLHLDNRPVIEITHEIHEMTSAASDALKADPDLFKRDCDLVGVTRIARDEAERSPLVKTEEGVRHELVEGTPRIRKILFPTLKERQSVLAQWVRYDKKEKKRKLTRPDGDVVAALLNRGEWPTVRELVGIAEAPFMRPDGTICQTPGYDAATRLLYVPTIPFPAVADDPPKADARAGLGELTDLLVDFPYEAPAHRMVPVAHLLTLLARPAIWGSTPRFVTTRTPAAAARACKRTSSRCLLRAVACRG